MNSDTAIAKCYTTMGNIINMFTKNIPTLKDMITCTDPKSKKTIVTPIPTSYTTITVKDNNLNGL